MTTPIDIYGFAIPSRSNARAFTAYAAAVMAAAEYAEDGMARNVECCTGPDKWQGVLVARWDWDRYTFRIAPSFRTASFRPKKFVTWRGPDDVPKGPAIWLRRKDETDAYLLEWIENRVVRFGGATLEYRILRDYQWSPDRIVWADCTVQVEVES